MVRRKELELPEGFDPYDMDLKRRINPNADETNFIKETKNGYTIACGTKRKGKICKLTAGFGTHHVGQGRCKFHGGKSTGPKTGAGKQKAAQNSRKHGFYSSGMLPREAELYEKLLDKKEVGLEDEIFAMKAKILIYLEKTKTKWLNTFESHVKSGCSEDDAVGNADKATKVWYSTGENGQGVRSYYHAGTIEDKALDRALRTLKQLVDSHAKLTGQSGESMLDNINQELRAASHGKVTMSWGSRKPQARQEGGADHGKETPDPERN